MLIPIDGHCGNSHIKGFLNNSGLLSTTEFLPTANHLSELLDTPK